jgi:hypothetical protein
VPECADCGANVTPGHFTGWWRDSKDSLVCRAEYDLTDDTKPRLLWADYHYVEGEVRRYWPAR